MNKDQITGIMIKLEADGKDRFYIALDSAGSINRSGTGRMMDEHDNLYIGLTKEPIFKKLIDNMSDTILKCVSKVCNIPCKCKEDIPCKLTVSFQIGQQTETAIFVYGYRCGLPIELRSLLKNAFELTQSWYDNQKIIAKDKNT